ncbi:protein slit-like [Anneissia japonica]|uniref:protein slit-like n=1 Tax=Anneissia japonica TaxID=1529436 RepID=UPI001425878C|nr:protein slit-like [Anneissia japonica]
MRYLFTITSIKEYGGMRCPLKWLLIYMLINIDTTQVFCYSVVREQSDTCGLQDGCRLDQQTGILNCKELDMRDIPRQTCPEVKHLDMRYNHLKRFSTGIDDYYPNLKELDFGAAKITSVSLKVFENCSTLIKIFMNSNAITNIEKDTFEGLTSLKYLYLSGNKLTRIQRKIFDPLNKTLLYLDHSHNKVQKIQEKAFQELSSLERLFLQNNRLTTINSGMLKGLKSLTHLYLSNNNITYVPHAAFKEMPLLHELKLGNNPGLISIHSGALNHLAQLRFLDLMRTDISTLKNVSHLFSHNSQLTNFYIADTPLVCDESFKLWETWYERTKSDPLQTATCSEVPSEPMTTITRRLSSEGMTYFNFLEEPNDARQNRMQVLMITAMTLLSLSLNT